MWNSRKFLRLWWDFQYYVKFKACLDHRYENVGKIFYDFPNLIKAMNFKICDS